MPEIMTRFLPAFEDELVKTALSPMVKSIATNSLLGMGFEAAFNRDSTPLSVVREGVGYGVGDEVATSIAKAMKFGRLGQIAAGIAGGSALAGALRKRFKDKPIQHAEDKLPDTEEFKAIKEQGMQEKVSAAVKSILTPQSSNVSGYSYDPATQDLNVTFKGGGTYAYKGVTPKHAKSLGRNKSVGKTINKIIKPNYEYEKIGKQTAFGEDYYDEADDAGWKDKIPGGLADDKFPTDFDFDALDKGIKVELEHTKDRRMAMEIAMDHLSEDKSYYDKLEKMESGEDKVAALAYKTWRIWAKHPAFKTPTLMNVSAPTRREAIDMIGAKKVVGGTPKRLTKKAAPKKVMEEVMEALRIRAMRGPHAKTIAARSLSRATPPPIPRRGNVQKPVAGEITAKKADIIKESMIRERIREGGTPKQAMAGIGAIAGLTRGMPMSTKRGRHPPKPIGHPVTKTASSIVESFAHARRSMMKSAGVAKRQVSFDGLPIKIEQDPGDIRKGVSGDGTPWSRKMHASYGYVPGTKGMGEDGDAVDVYLAKDPVVGKVFTVKQNKKDGSFDESKHMLGYDSAAAAKADYMKHMPEWAFGSMESESWDSFKGKYGKKAA
jgi:hypothetical protein